MTLIRATNQNACLIIKLFYILQVLQEHLELFRLFPSLCTLEVGEVVLE